MTTSPKFYLIGTKYGRSEDVLPEMILTGVISTGFAPELDLEPIMGKDLNTARTWIDNQIPNESGTARGTLAMFAAMRPGDVVALKAHSAPHRRQARLVIARYAIVAGSTSSVYSRSDVLGHTLKVDFLDDQELIELPLGYGQTLHLIDDPIRIKTIFGRYAYPAQLAAPTSPDTLDRSTHSTEVLARGAYLMQRIHNEIQNEFRALLIARYGESAITQEEQFVDLIVRLPSKTMLIEVKSSPSPIACIREAIGQLLQYSCKLGLRGDEVLYLVVGPSEIDGDGSIFIEHVIAETQLSILYCNPASFCYVDV